MTFGQALCFSSGRVFHGFSLLLLRDILFISLSRCLLFICQIFQHFTCTDDVFLAVKRLLCPEGMIVVCLGE